MCVEWMGGGGWGGGGYLGINSWSKYCTPNIRLGFLMSCTCISSLLNSCSCVCLVCWKPNEVAIQYGSRLPEQPPVYAGHRTAPCVCRAQNSPLVYAGHRTAPCVCQAQNSPLCMPGTEQPPVYAGHRTAPCVCRAQNSPLCMPGTEQSPVYAWHSLLQVSSFSVVHVSH